MVSPIKNMHAVCKSMKQEFLLFCLIEYCTRCNTKSNIQFEKNVCCRSLVFFFNTVSAVTVLPDRNKDHTAD